MMIAGAKEHVLWKKCSMTWTAVPPRCCNYSFLERCRFKSTLRYYWQNPFKCNPPGDTYQRKKKALEVLSGHIVLLFVRLLNFDKFSNFPYLGLTEMYLPTFSRSDGRNECSAHAGRNLYRDAPWKMSMYPDVRSPKLPRTNTSMC